MAAAGVLSAASPSAAAQTQAPVQIVLSNTRSLDFGRFVAGSGGTVTLAPSGFRSSTGVILLNSPSAGPADFQVSVSPLQTSDLAIVISLPPDGSISLSNGSSSMPVNAFVSSSFGGITLPVGGLSLKVGATMTVAPRQPSGNYSGSFPLIVNFQ